MIPGSLPRRYARALTELATEENRLEAFGDLLEGLLREFQKSPDILEALAKDSFEPSERKGAIEEIAKRAGLPPILKNFLLLLVDKERIGLFPEIIREYRRFRDEILGIVRVVAYGPAAPEGPTLQKIEEILGRKLKKKVIASGEARPEMIGGLIFKRDHIVYDGSVRRELEGMREVMLKG